MFSLYGVQVYIVRVAQCIVGTVFRLYVVQVYTVRVVQCLGVRCMVYCHYLLYRVHDSKCWDQGDTYEAIYKD